MDVAGFDSMRRWLVLIVTMLVLAMPGQGLAQEATPEGGVYDSFVQGDGLSFLAEQRYDRYGIGVLGIIDSYDGPALAVAFHNMFETSFRDLSVVIEARTADGTLFAVGSGNYQGFSPTVIAPDGYAFGLVTFDGAEIDDTMTFVSDVRVYEADQEGSSGTENFRILELNHYPDRFVGTVKNLTRWTAGSAQVAVLCFGHFGKPTWFDAQFTELGSIPAGGHTAFQIDIPLSANCTSFVAAAVGANFDD